MSTVLSQHGLAQAARQNWRPWALVIAGLACLYLAMGFKHGLIPLPEERPVRFPRPAYA